MKISDKIYGKVVSSIQNITNPVRRKAKFEQIQDSFIKSARPAGIPADNILSVKKNVYGEYIFNDGKKKVGYAAFVINKGEYGDPAIYPPDWFDSELAPNIEGKYKMKPYMYITEFAMNDRLGKKTLEKRDKKYGTMAMQHLIRLAKENDCESRIVLYAGEIGKTKFLPGRFYHKMGFSLPYKVIKVFDKMEAEYNKELTFLLEHDVPKDKAEKILEFKDLYLPEKKDGRYIADDGFMILTNPECAMNYPLK